MRVWGHAMVESVPNVLAARYASAEMVQLWSPARKVVFERELWIAVLKAQRDLGLDIPNEAIAAYERTKEQVDRSEEHTSELQSREKLVCRLLLEKKNHI